MGGGIRLTDGSSNILQPVGQSNDVGVIRFGDPAATAGKPIILYETFKGIDAAVQVVDHLEHSLGDGSPSRRWHRESVPSPVRQGSALPRAVAGTLACLELIPANVTSD